MSSTVTAKAPCGHQKILQFKIFESQSLQIQKARLILERLAEKHKHASLSILSDLELTEKDLELAIGSLREIRPEVMV